MEGEPKNQNGIPTVGNDVTVYSGSVVVGDIVLHDKCQIGANSYVDKEVEALTVACGNPGQTLKLRNVD